MFIYMKKLFTIVLTMLAAITVGTSCKGSSADITYSAFVTVIEGTWDIPYYVMFEDGKTAYVENYKEWTPAFSDKWKELRYIVYYTESGAAKQGYDKTINITAYQPVSMDHVQNVTDTDFTGENGLQTFNGSFDIIEAYFSQPSGFLTLSLLVPMSDTALKHQVKVVRNLSENNPYKEYYESGDDYLWLEAYYYMGEDSDSYQATSYMCYKVNEESLGVDTLTSSYRGIKIVLNSYDQADVIVYTLDF